MTDDERIGQLLERVRTIAVVGIKAGEEEDAHRVPRYLQGCGYRVVPVNPKLESVLGERCYPSLGEVPEPVDLVNLFRAPRFVPGHVDELLALSPRPVAVWLQLGIRSDADAERLERAGVVAVQDRCLMVEHRRLCPDAPRGRPGGAA